MWTYLQPATAFLANIAIKWALYSAEAWISVLNPLLEILTLSIAVGEKLLDNASSSFLHLNTQLSTPVTATLTSFLNFAT